MEGEPAQACIGKVRRLPEVELMHRTNLTEPGE